MMQDDRIKSSCLAFYLPGLSQPTLLKKNLVPRFGQWISAEKCGTFGRIKETREVLVEVVFSFPCSFFLSVMTPLNLIHFNYLPSSTSFFPIEDFEGILNIREVGFYQDFLLIDDFGQNSDTFLEFGYVENIMDGCESRRKSQSISHWYTFFNDLIWSDIARC